MLKQTVLHWTFGTSIQMFSDSRVLDIAAGLRHSMAVTGVDNDAFYITTVENFNMYAGHYAGQAELWPILKWQDI